MKLLRTLSEYRWPIYLGGLLAMSVVACGTLVWVATRPSSPRPIKGYYQAAREWDAEEAVADASRELGWTVRYELPSDVPHYAGMPRPLDVRVSDRAGQPVTGLAGKLFAVRPSDTRLNQAGDLTELPQQPGTYRTLILLDEPGAWELRLDATYGGAAVSRGKGGAGVPAPSEALASRQVEGPAAAGKGFRFVHLARFDVLAGAALPDGRAR